MVQKDEMCAIFKTLKSVDRIEILCGMLQLCVPQELRFIGSCLEDLIQKSYKSLYDVECVANDSKQLQEVASSLKNKIDRELCSTLNTYLSLLHSDNTSCAHSIFSILDDLKASIEARVVFQECVFSEISSGNCDIFDDIILIFTMASYHPAFTIDQRLKMYEMCRSFKEILKETSSQVNSEECGSSFVEVEDNNSNKGVQDIPINIRLKPVPNNVKLSNEFVLQVTWSNGPVTECVRSKEHVLRLHSELVRTFPEVGDLLKMDPSCFTSSLPNFPGSNSSEAYEEYFQELMLLPRRIITSGSMMEFVGDSRVFLNHVRVINDDDVEMEGEREEDDDRDSMTRSHNSSVSHLSSLSEDLSNCSFNTLLATDSVSKSASLSASCWHHRSKPSVSQQLSNRKQGFLNQQQHRTTILPSVSFSHPPRFRNNNRGYNQWRWNHSSDKTNTARSLANERVAGSQRTKEPKCSLSETKNYVVSTSVSRGSYIEAMKDCEEIDSQVIMTELSAKESQSMNNQGEPHFECYPDCVAVSGGGDNFVKHHSNCSKFSFSDSTSLLKNNPIMLSASSCADSQMSPPIIPESNVIVTATTSSSKTLRPILGALANQTYNSITDDSRTSFPPRLDNLPLNSVSFPSLPRASSCGVLLQVENDVKHQNSEESNPNTNFTPISFLPNIAYNFDTFYNQTNVDSRINYVSPSPYFHFNQQADSIQPHAHPPPIPLANLAHHITTSHLPPFSNSLSTPPLCSCSCCPSVASYPSYPIWQAPHLLFRSNGMVAPRFPPINVRNGAFVKPHFDYVQYDSGMIPSISATVVTSVPSSTSVPPIIPQLSQSSTKIFCHNCGSSNHSADSCSEPFMLSVGQAAQFKLKAVPKTDSMNS